MAALAVAFDGVGSGAGFLFCGVSVCGFADDTGQKVYQDMIYYTITPMHEVTITGARAILTEANIPAEPGRLSGDGDRTLCL